MTFARRQSSSSINQAHPLPRFLFSIETSKNSAVYDLERDKPTRPERPPPPVRKPGGGSLLPVMLVLVLILILIVGVVAFTGLAGLLMVAVIASVPAFMMLHYLLWGYWLGKNIRDAEESQEDEEDDD